MFTVGAVALGVCLCWLGSGPPGSSLILGRMYPFVYASPRAPGLGASWDGRTAWPCLLSGNSDGTPWTQLCTLHSLCFITAPLVFKTSFILHEETDVRALQAYTGCHSGKRKRYFVFPSLSMEVQSFSCFIFSCAF